MSLFFVTLTLHIVFVIAWMAAVFYLPRILVNIAEIGDAPAVRDRLVLMGKRLYRFGHIMFGLAFAAGMGLWLGYHIGGPWLYVKLTMVAILLGYFSWTGRLLKGVASGKVLPSSKALRWINELPVLLLLIIVYLAVAKPAL